eukprot:TRINITY_DN15577_c0_g1_i1.p1 TRINITY_DN15577_c0_g1~~TRINITY_DN15577_c0_g1_i1.p1  ORF type:complete len:783 (-),score=137.65 TRINITY_DN15577_c0_g1_i1:1346-3694(-)
MHSQYPSRNISSFISRRELSSFSGRPFEDSVLSSTALYSKLGIELSFTAGGGEARGFTCAAFDESGDYLAVGREDASILLIDYQTRKNWALRVSRHSAAISAISFQPYTNASRLISGGFDRSLVITDPIQVAAVGIYDCLTARARRIAHEENPFVFFTGSEEGCVRMFDLREKHRCDPNSCRSSALLDLRREKLRHLNFNGREVVSTSISMMDITGLAINPSQPYHMALGCNDPVVRIYDRRMLTPGGSSSQQAKPIHKFLPSPVIENNRAPLGNVFVNDLRFNHDGSLLLASYNGHGIFILDSGSLVKMSMMKDTVRQQSVKKKRKASALSSGKSQQTSQTEDAMDIDAPKDSESDKGTDGSSAASNSSPRPKKKRKTNSQASLASAPEEPEPTLPPLRPRGPQASTTPDQPLPAPSQLFSTNPISQQPAHPATAASNGPDAGTFLPMNLFSMMTDPRATHTAFPLDELLQPQGGPPPAALTAPAMLQQALRQLFSSLLESTSLDQVQVQPDASAALQPQPQPQAPPQQLQSPFSADMIRDLTRAIMMESMNAPLPTGLDEDQPPAPPQPTPSSSSNPNLPTPHMHTKSYSDCDGAFLQHLQGHLHFERDLKDSVFMGPKSEFVVSGSEDGNLFVWNSSTGSLAALIMRGGTTDNIRVIAAPTRTVRLASIGHTTMLNVWGPTRSEKSMAFDASPAQSPASNCGKTATPHEVTEICSKNIAHMRDHAEHRRGRPRVNVDVIRLEEPLNAQREPNDAVQPPPPTNAPPSRAAPNSPGSCAIQ